MSVRILIILILITYFKISAAQYASQNISLLYNWYDPFVTSEPIHGIKYNGVWGYTDTLANKQYAIIGSTAGTYIIEVTNPTNCILRDYIEGRRDSCIWREYKTYKNYLYIISDDPGPNSFQIADLSYLPDSVHIAHDSDSLFERAHTLFIDGAKLYLASVTGVNKSFYHGISVYSLADPENPAILRTLEQDYYNLGLTVHDIFVRNDTIYASCGYNGLYIFKLLSNNTFSLIGSLTSYPDQGFNHSSSLTEDGKTLVFCDEVPDNTAVKVFDVSDLGNLQLKSIFKSNEGATPHNPYILGNNKLIIAYYQDGVQVYDIADPGNPYRIGYFDTYPQNGNMYTLPSYAGSWGVYTDLSGEILLASDMQNGLFVLDASSVLGNDELKQKEENLVKVFPNPFNDEINIVFQNIISEKAEIILRDNLGRIIRRESLDPQKNINNFRLDIQSDLHSNIYFLSVKTSSSLTNYKLLKY